MLSLSGLHILIDFLSGTDPESGSINGKDHFDITIIIAVVGAAVIVIVLVALLVHMFYKRNRNQKVMIFIIYINYVNCYDVVS